MNEQKLKKKLSIMIATVILLICGLTVTSFALVNSIVSIRNNRFSMSMGVALNINDGQPVVDVTDVLYEPGGTYISEFPIENLSTFDVLYRVYFTDVEGALKDNIIVTVKEENGTVLCNGAMDDLGSDNVVTSSLPAGEKRKLYIEFYFSPNSDNTSQGQTVSFNITADATQIQNVDFGH